MKNRGQIRMHHDEWTKRVLSLWLCEMGEVELDARIAGHSRRGDVLYMERHHSPAVRERLGMLGELARGEVLFEPFRNPPTPFEFKSCVMKVVDLEASEARAARRSKAPLSTVRGPSLCVITPSMSTEFAGAVGAHRTSDGKAGLYTLAPAWGVVVVVANELPIERATLFLRLLGRGAVQRAAVVELADSVEHEEMRDATIELLIAWRQSLPSTVEPREDEQELKMNLERVYERWEKKVKAEGRREGKAEGKAEAVLAVLQGRGLAVTSEQRKQVLACTESAQLDAWLCAAITTSSARALLAGSAPQRARARRGAARSA